MMMEETRRKVFLLRSGPGEPATSGVFHLAQTLRAQGRWSVGIVLVQDAVLCALQQSGLESALGLRALIQGGASCHYLAEDLAMRGYAPSAVLSGCEPVGYEGLVDLLLADGAGVAGAF